MTTITVLVGNPKPQSRTLLVCRSVASAIALVVPEPRMQIIDIVDHAERLFTWPDEVMSGLTEAVSSSDVVIVGSPTYKAAYTGMLKSFLDRYPKRGLEGVVAVPVMTGADMTHAMSPDIYLRALLVELGATTPTPSLFFTVPRFSELTEIVSDWADRSAPLVASAVATRRVMLDHTRT